MLYRGLSGFYARHFPVSAALCDGGAYLLSVAAIPSPPQRRAAILIYYTYAHVVGCVGPCQCAPWLGLELVPLARTYTGEPGQRLRQLGHGDRRVKRYIYYQVANQDDHNSMCNLCCSNADSIRCHH